MLRYTSMCARYTLRTTPKILATSLGVEDLPLFEPRFNISPTQTVLAVRTREDRPAREAVFLRWGLVPAWAKELRFGQKCINARADTIADKPAFRTAFEQRRCLVAADGFYEWQPVGDKKQPWHFRLKEGRPFAFAGLWECWKSPEGEPVESCTLITTDANELVQPIHDRMPVILPPEEYHVWLNRADEPRRLLSLLRPFPAAEMEKTAADPEHLKRGRA